MGQRRARFGSLLGHLLKSSDSMQLSLRVSSQFGHISAFIELLRDLYRAKTVNVSSRHLPTTGIEPVFCRLQRLVLTTITTLAWRADLDSNEDEQFWRLRG